MFSMRILFATNCPLLFPEKLNVSASGGLDDLIFVWISSLIDDVWFGKMLIWSASQPSKRSHPEFKAFLV